MPFFERTGDLFESPSDLDAVAHGVNCKGVMGKGVALAFAQRYPDMKKHYVALCEQRLMSPGRCDVWVGGHTYVYNLATQNRPGPDAKLRWVAESVASMLQHAEDHGVGRIGIPRIGCGIGGLQWVEVRMILELLALESTVDLVVYSLDDGWEEARGKVTRWCFDGKHHQCSGGVHPKVVTKDTVLPVACRCVCHD